MKKLLKLVWNDMDKNLKNALIVIVILVGLYYFISPYQNLGEETKKYIYKCNDKISARSCDETCSQVDELWFNIYKVNIKNNTVIKNLYFKNTLTNTAAYDDCKVVDESNWICTLKNKSYKTIMTDGKTYLDGSTGLDKMCEK